MNETIDIYDQIAGDYAASFIEKEDEAIFIRDFLENIQDNGQIIDLGCGNCDYYYMFKQYPITYKGIDLSQSMITTAKKQWPDGNFSLNDIMSFNFSKNSYSGVFAFYSLMHLSKIDFETIIKKIKNALKPKGMFLLAVQEGDGEIYQESPFLKGHKMLITQFKESDLSILLRSMGFKIIRKETIKPTSDKEHSNSKILLLMQNNT